MIQVTYKLKLGRDEFELRADVKDEKEFFETMAFYSSLPRVAPGGSDDLKVAFRTTKKGHKYYSLVSETEKKEYKLGQNLENNGGGLFPKGWSDLFAKDDDGEEQGAPAAAAPTFGRAATPTYTAPKESAPAAAAAPTTAKATAPTFGQPAKAAPAPTPEAAAPASNPNVTAVANNVLARFGINK